MPALTPRPVNAPRNCPGRRWRSLEGGNRGVEQGSLDELPLYGELKGGSVAWHGQCPGLPIGNQTKKSGDAPKHAVLVWLVI